MTGATWWSSRTDSGGAGHSAHRGRVSCAALQVISSSWDSHWGQTTSAWRLSEHVVPVQKAHAHTHKACRRTTIIRLLKVTLLKQENHHQLHPTEDISSKKRERVSSDSTIDGWRFHQDEPPWRQSEAIYNFHFPLSLPLCKAHLRSAVRADVMLL